MRNRVSWRRAGPAFGLLAILGGCAQGQGFNFMSGGGADDDPGINVRPANYRSEILAGMHAYLNDPTGVRDAGIGEPAIKTVNNTKRYVVCVRFNAKKARGEYAGTREVAAVFVAGRFDRFAEVRRDSGKDTGERDPASEPRGPCADATYAAFPELEKLSR